MTDKSNNSNGRTARTRITNATTILWAAVAFFTLFVLLDVTLFDYENGRAISTSRTVSISKRRSILLLSSLILTGLFVVLDMSSM